MELKKVLGLRETRIWLISDTHFGHKNIILHENRPEDHEAIMLRNLEMVEGDDILIHLGDVALWRKPQVKEWAKKLPDRTILVEGNHDIKPRTKKVRDWFAVIGRGEQPFTFKRGGKKFAMSHWKTKVKETKADFYLFGHSHGKIKAMERSEGRTFFNLSVEHWDYKPVLLDDLVLR